ncbi:glycosyltransferase [Methylobacterium sp. BTF04]|uniref:glycosyltransferase n=1 Tax=Methylobacterium sp. BTF04 TaxID=2708300 RepID=UPI0013D45454|nr:glycosyltransferase [Methylobacterium sp. BTF04]NEU13405.1 glycosyltransferase [Methylobacterium sp. BTF04]
MIDRRIASGPPPDAGTDDSEDAHGVAAWPFATQAWPADMRPDALPDGRPWPQVLVLIVPGGDDANLSTSAASVAAQGYPESRYAALPSGAAGQAIRQEIVTTVLADPTLDYLIVLRAGDLLAPGALAALCLEAVMSGADLVAGLRVVFDRHVIGLDAIGQAPGKIAGSVPSGGTLAPFTGGEILIARTSLVDAGGLEDPGEHAVAAAWPHLAATGARLARIGRPVLLQRAPGADPGPIAGGLTVAAVTDRGYGGGAGIAHRRLADALALAGHAITDLRLDAEAIPAAAEWTDDFPRTRDAVRDGAYGLVLAGNIHGVTRRTEVLAQLGRYAPVAAVLHDFFPVTGRCAFPAECAVIATGCDARCPSPTQYPQLAPNRIAAAYTAKQALLAGPGAPLLLANSAWTADFARRLAPPGTAIERIDLAFPTGVFRPGDRADLRNRLGLPARDVLVMFAAVIADAPGKGFADLVATLKRVARPGITFVAVGRLDDPAATGLSNLICAGPVGDEATLAQWYGACDLYITASRNETLGQTPVEAGLCGTPTVAYRASGLTNAVIDGVSGVLVPIGPDTLADALAALIADPERRRALGAWGRIALESRFSHAAAAMRMQDVLAARGLVPAQDRIRFLPEMLARFAFAKERHPGRTGTVPAPSPSLVRLVRRAKQAALGRGQPLWLRRVLYVAIRITGRVKGMRR